MLASTLGDDSPISHSLSLFRTRVLKWKNVNFVRQPTWKLRSLQVLPAKVANQTNKGAISFRYLATLSGFFQGKIGLHRRKTSLPPKNRLTAQIREPFALKSRTAPFWWDLQIYLKFFYIWPKPKRCLKTKVKSLLVQGGEGWERERKSKGGVRGRMMESRMRSGSRIVRQAGKRKCNANCISWGSFRVPNVDCWLQEVSPTSFYWKFSSSPEYTKIGEHQFKTWEKSLDRILPK